MLLTNYKNDAGIFILIIKFVSTENFRGNSAYGLNLIELKFYIFFSIAFLDPRRPLFSGDFEGVGLRDLPYIPTCSFTVFRLKSAKNLRIN